MKIAIIGSPGSGKSTLAFQLHQILHIPLFHLDQYFWKPGWQRPDYNEFVQTHYDLCDRDSWIIEGMAMRILEYRLFQAEVIIFLDIPLYIVYIEYLKEHFLNFGKVFFSSAPGCPEKFPDWEFLKYVWSFNKKQKRSLEYSLHSYKDQKQVFVVKNEKELDELIERFKSGNI